MHIPQWAQPVSQIAIAAIGFILLLAGQRLALPGRKWALAGLALFILGRFLSIGIAILPLRLHETGIPLSEIGHIIFYWSLLRSLLSLAAYVFLAVGLWQGSLLKLKADWRQKDKGRFPAAGWARRGIFLLLLAGLISLGIGLIPALSLHLFKLRGITGVFSNLSRTGHILLDGVGLLYLVGAFAYRDGLRGQVDTDREGSVIQGSPAAGLVHLAVLFHLAGALVVMVVSVLQRDTNSHLARHARQAFEFQTGVILVDAAAALLLAAVYPFFAPQAEPLRLVAWLLILFHLTVLVFALYAAWQGWRGRPYNYPLFTRLPDDWAKRKD